MKAKELRIGNYIIEFKGIKDNENKYSIKKVNTRILRLIESETRTDNYLSFIPIPLTEEILLKCGAEKINHIDGSKFHLIQNKKTNIKIRFYKTLVSVNSSFSIYDLKYLHQLQNLYFALTGEELNVNL